MVDSKKMCPVTFGLCLTFVQTYYLRSSPKQKKFDCDCVRSSDYKKCHIKPTN